LLDFLQNVGYNIDTKFFGGAFMQKVKKILPFIAAGLALLAVIFLALPAGEWIFEDGEGIKFRGFALIFGGKLIWVEGTYTSTEPYFAFSFVNFLSFLFVIAGMAFAIAGVMTKKKAFAFVAAGLFLVATIFFFCLIRGVAFDKTAEAFEGYTQAELNMERALFIEACDLGVGAILPAICSLLAGVAVLVPAFIPDEK